MPKKGDPLIKHKSVIAYFGRLGITVQKTAKDWIALYKGKPLRSLAIRHAGETGIKIPYVWKILKEKLIRDGLEPGSKEYELELKRLKKEALGFI
tara:strand:- start:222 stop:506 length:285 start_codon:yes stop_codon:yes gene_type:complete